MIDLYFGTKDGEDTIVTGHPADRKIHDPKLWDDQVWVDGVFEKIEMIANRYDTSERTQIVKVSSDAIRKYLVDAKSKNAIDFRCGTGLVGMNLLNDFNSMLFLDTSQNMINQVKLTDMMTEIGYRNIQSKTFYNGSKIFMGHDASMFILDSKKINI